ncbi:MAG: transglutaminase domain-containing protein [Tindallia sp. MSAO_Bac2]|nr:MAG: transglutaminase domain-containing protein [Tindallia sp. MSAO_Bac2]
MKKAVSILIILFVLAVNVITISALELSALNFQALETGVLSVEYQMQRKSNTRIMIENNGERHFYRLPYGAEKESFPLKQGNGEYTISILEHVSGNQYRPVVTEKLYVDAVDENKMYLGSVQEIKWNESMAPIMKAKELTKNLEADREKVEAIHQYIVQNIKYDYDIIPYLTSDYLPDIERIFETQKGICYDYASLFAAMLRSVGIPARMVKGYAPGIAEYHAWNEVLVDGEWSVIDTTMDAAFAAGGVAYDMIKNAEEFQKKIAI